MKHLLIILFLFPLVTFSQKDTLFWKVIDERNIPEYQIQKTNIKGEWVFKDIVAKKKNADSLAVKNYIYVQSTAPVSTYYRVIAIKDTVYSTGPILVKFNDNTVAITVPVFKSNQLTWTVNNEFNVFFYLIEKSLDGTTWTQTTKITDKGNGKYTYRPASTTKKYLYRIVPVFRDGTNGLTTNFIKL